MTEYHNVITHLQQTQKLNCASACLAMLTDKTVEEVTEDFHEGYTNNIKEVWEYLEQNDVLFTILLAGCRLPDLDKVYLASVPSLNIKGGLHYIVIETTEDGNWWIYDPNLGREEVMWYVASDKHVINEQSFAIKSYQLEIEIPRQFYRDKKSN